MRDFLCRIAESAGPTLAHAERLEKIEMSRSKDAPNPFIRLGLAAGLSMWRCPENSGRLWKSRERARLRRSIGTVTI